LLLVEDPRRQSLMLRIKDSTMTLNPNIGYCQLNLAELQDCVPRTMWVKLKRDGPFGPKKVPGRVRIALTYKSYVDEEEEDSDEKEGSLSPYIKVYGDAGAESVEDIGISLGEAIDASLMEEAKRESEGEIVTTDDETEIISTEREDSTVEVTTSPKSSSRNGNGDARAPGTNGSAASRRRVDHSERVRKGNGAVLRREQTDLHPKTDSSEEEFNTFSRGFGDNGDVRVPRGKENGVAGKHMNEGGQDLEDSRAAVLDRELESLTTRSSEAREALLESHHWKRSSYSDASAATPTVDHTVFPTRPDQKDEDFIRVENEAEVGAEETLKDLSPKTEGNKLLWLCMFTTVAYVIGCSLHLSNPLHP